MANQQTGLKNGVNMNLTYQQEQGLEPMPDWYKPMAAAPAAKSRHPPGTVYKHADGYYADPIPTGTNDYGNSGPLGGFAALANATAAERNASMAREAAREAKTTAGWDQQIESSRLMGQQGYDRLSQDYGLLTADAEATRARNLERVNQYGNSMREDLRIKNIQNLAASRQSAIQRGLGNTTIYNSLERGANFDNTRQVMSLEDQLLQNRITTDSNLSKTYQDTLQSRATGLANQWQQNIGNANQLASSKLGYIGSILEDKDYDRVSNIYAQGLAQTNANQQAAIQLANANQQAAYDRQLEAQKTPAKFRYVNGQVQKSLDNGHSWQLDTDQQQSGGRRSAWL